MSQYDGYGPDQPVIFEGQRPVYESDGLTDYGSFIRGTIVPGSLKITDSDGRPWAWSDGPDNGEFSCKVKSEEADGRIYEVKDTVLRSGVDESGGRSHFFDNVEVSLHWNGTAMDHIGIMTGVPR